MGDFLKRFRRQRSIKQSFSESSENHNENVILNSNQEKELNDKSSEHLSYISTETCNSSTVKNKEENAGFKEPKGWRKSLRKLKLKKRQPTSSISYDNIAKMPNNVENSNVDIQNPNIDGEASISKRWSYSPDLSEDNVPGARELRGTIERKLSVKHEVDEKNYFAKYCQNDKQKELHLTESISNCVENVKKSDIKDFPSGTCTKYKGNKNNCIYTFQSPESCQNDVNKYSQNHETSDHSVLCAIAEKNSVLDYTSSENADFQSTAENETAYSSMTLFYFSVYCSTAHNHKFKATNFS